MSAPLNLTRSTTALVVIMKCLGVAQGLLRLKPLLSIAAFQANAFQNNAFQVYNVDIHKTWVLQYWALFKVYRELNQQKFRGWTRELQVVIIQATEIVGQMSQEAQTILPTLQTTTSLAQVRLVLMNGYQEIKKAIC